MPQVVYSPAANRDLERLYFFLAEKDEAVARRAITTIDNSLRILASQPQAGRHVEDLAENFREWVINFGDSGYTALYNFDGSNVVILTIRHQKEAGN